MFRYWPSLLLLIPIACQLPPAAAQSQTRPSQSPAQVDSQPPSAEPVENRTASEPIEEIVVVGTRAQPRTVAESVVPIDVIPADEIASQGDNDIADRLRNVLPSYNVNAQPVGDAARIVRPAGLRGLAPDHTLVLVNGRRRHRSAVITWLGGGIADGAQGPDISVIPSIALRQVEVLRDGASAQYGSDAIAGVLNFLIKDDPSGGSVEFRSGRFIAGDGVVDGSAGCPTVAVGDAVSHREALSRVLTDPDCFSFQEIFPGGFTPRFGGELRDSARESRGRSVRTPRRASARARTVFPASVPSPRASGIAATTRSMATSSSRTDRASAQSPLRAGSRTSTVSAPRSTASSPGVFNWTGTGHCAGARAAGSVRHRPGQQHAFNVSTRYDLELRELVNDGVIPSISRVAQLRGGRLLEPERSMNYSLGAVMDGTRLRLTADYFRIDLSNRLALTQSFTLNPAEVGSLIAEGVTSARNLQSFRFFTNDFETRTHGIDLVATYAPLVLGGGTAFSLLLNHTDTEVTAFDRDVLDPERIRQLEDAVPASRWNFTARHAMGRWRLLGRLSYYGAWYDSRDARAYGGEHLFDLEASFRIRDALVLTAGVQNLFDTPPERNPNAAATGNRYSAYAPFNYNGAFYYLRVAYDRMAR